jgi:hypothetical protein
LFDGAPKGRIRGKLRQLLQAIGEKFPTTQNREFIRSEQGIKSIHQGIEQPHQGIPAGVGMPTSGLGSWIEELARQRHAGPLYLLPFLAQSGDRRIWDERAMNAPRLRR